MSSVKKRHHFVQKAYLNKFCNEEGYLYAYDKDNLTSFPAQPKDVANKHRFYDFPFEEDRQAQTIENKLSEFDDLQKICIESFTTNVDIHIENTSFSTEVLDIEQRIELAHIIGLQLLRTLKHRKFISNCFQSTKHKLKQEADEIHKEDMRTILGRTPEEYRSLVKEFLINTKEAKINLSIEYINWLYSDEGLSIIQGEDMFRRCKDIAEILLKHIWMIGINTFEDKSFYTSDHPVAKIPHLYGIASKGVEISFPLNSEIILILLERENFKQYEVFENKIVKLTSEQIEHYNSMQIISSDRQIYCRNNDFELVVKTVENSSFDLSS